VSEVGIESEDKEDSVLLVVSGVVSDSTASGGGSGNSKADNFIIPE